MAEKNESTNSLDAVFKSMETFVSTKSVVGEAINVGDTTILPLVDVSVGVAAGAGNNKNAGGGMGLKLTPSAVLVVKDGNAKLVNIKQQDGLTKILDMVPDFLDRFTSKDTTEEVIVEEKVD
jgi:uncharacterized spore protein YtfJ